MLKMSERSSAAPQVRPDVDEERAQEILDKIWSLQYMIPAGALCAFAGRLLPGQSGQAGSLSAFTHAAHFRFSGEKVMSMLGRACFDVA